MSDVDLTVPGDRGLVTADGGTVRTCDVLSEQLTVVQLVKRDAGQRGGFTTSAGTGSALLDAIAATRLVLLPPNDPESKGLVERRKRLVRDLLHARARVRLPGGLQHPVHRLVDRRERAGPVRL